MPDVTKHIANLSRKVDSYMLRDICNIYTRGSVEGSVDMWGVVTYNPTAVLYNGVKDIPCRYEISRAFKPENSQHTLMVSDETYLVLPKGLGQLDVNNKIINPSTGEEFVIRNATGQGRFFDEVTVYRIEELSSMKGMNDIGT